MQHSGTLLACMEMWSRVPLKSTSTFLKGRKNNIFDHIYRKDLCLKAEVFEKEIATTSHLAIIRAGNTHFPDLSDSSGLLERMPEALGLFYVYVHGDCDNMEVEASVGELMKQIRQKGAKSDLETLQAKAMEQTLSSVISAVTWAVFDSRVGLQNWKQTSVRERVQFWGEQIDEYPGFVAQQLYPEESKSVSFPIIYSHPTDPACARCIEWNRHRTIALLEAAWTHVVSRDKEHRNMKAVENVWRTVARDTYAREDICLAKYIKEIPSYIGDRSGRTTIAKPSSDSFNAYGYQNERKRKRGF